ncbi:phage holin family protein [Chitiniphilus purpureus]|uniref:Phage holin family protein n=1 Tax=Chitiniphilus purpureus TaxID=2981137 RepID=A0ABY6DLB1_9NEIS|nr:phage holin family protein [Chitiniphilus sp. CD1]UXY15149.1 phage holin family protein [Chitiniphilus sp. CD1]
MSQQQTSSGPLRRLVGGILGLLHAHLGIFSIELEEARERLVRTLVLGVLGAGLWVMCLIAFAWALVLALPESWRVPVLTVGGIVLLLLGALLVRLAWNGMTRAPLPFAVTLEELRRDRERLSS